ncbi:hypothetical protein MKW98_029593 [Papaver atlanticum]|uniref:Uncharacterized protein n=1 Tax=Papaver atlanticum TaxID=357466 RepID=A0AAD4X9E7_9MAGN|nr:hypothetical protein MKW98_029593 [Papaver atlanticum]
MAISFSSSTTLISPRIHSQSSSRNATKFQPLSFFTCTNQNPRLSSQISSKKSFTGEFSVHCYENYYLQKFTRKPKFRIFAIKEESPFSSQASNNKSRILVGSAITVVLAVANRVLYKLALVPMKEYPFFLAQVTTFGYVAFYFSILYLRYCAGKVTKEMLALPKTSFLVIGILEALGVAAGMYSGAMLPGPTIPILNQTFLVWQLIFSTLILGRKYPFNQIAGCLLVAAGVVAAVASGSNDAGASILKEFVFIDAAKRLKGKPLDIFVVNSFGSGFQALFVLFLPVLSSLKGIPFAELPSYLKSGAACFLNIGNQVTDCAGAPWLPLLFISTNMAFNISLLNLVQISSAVVSSLVITLAVPLTIFILTLPLPYLPEATTLSPFFLVGSVILVLGLLVYYIPQRTKPSSQI